MPPDQTKLKCCFNLFAWTNQTGMSGELFYAEHYFILIRLCMNEVCMPGIFSRIEEFLYLIKGPYHNLGRHIKLALLKRIFMKCACLR